MPQRWRDLEFYASDSWKLSPRITFDYGVRYSLFYNPYSADDKIMSFDPATFNASLGSDPCNGLLQAPGANWCQSAGLLGGATGPNRSLFPQDSNNFAPRLGLAWDIKGDGKSALRAGLGQFYLRERLSSGAEHREQPAVHHDGERHSGHSTRTHQPVMGARSITRWERPTRAESRPRRIRTTGSGTSPIRKRSTRIRPGTSATSAARATTC